MLKKNAKFENEKEKCRSVFMFFMQKFYRDLTNDTDLKETVVAIRDSAHSLGLEKESVLNKKKSSERTFRV